MDARTEIPKRGVRESDIKVRNGQQNAVGANKALKVDFKDMDGEVKLGFYKRINEHYPEFLAKLSVLASIICRIILGTRAAEDRLVFDAAGKIIGSLSVALPNFKSFLLNTDKEPEDKEEKELRNPCTETLLKHNILELLMVCYFGRNDDLHPENLSLEIVLDFDYFFVFLTEVIKGERTIKNWLVYNSEENSPKKDHVREKDIHNFPVVTEAFHTHWPTHSMPGNLNYEKAFRRYKEFVNLAGNPSVKINGATVTAQDQITMAILKIVLTKQPAMVQKRLKDYFGKIPMNYQSLPMKIQLELQERAPNFFNNKTNQAPFVDFAYDYYQFIYDAFYRVCVFSAGCEKNDYGVPVPPFSEQLWRNPKYYTEIKKCLYQRNQQMKEQVDGKEIQNQHSLLRSIPVFQEGKSYIGWSFSIPQESKSDDENKLDKTYHQVYRDSFAPKMYQLWLKAVYLIKAMMDKLKSKHIEFVELNGMRTDDSRLVTARGIFGEPKFVSMEEIKTTFVCDESHGLRCGLIGRDDNDVGMIQLIKQWFDSINKYYSKTQEELKKADAQNFVDEIYINLYSKYKNILQYFGNVTSYASDLENIMEELWCMVRNMNFANHVLNCIPSNNLTSSQSRLFVIPINKQSIIKQLFEWVDSLPENEIEQYLKNILKSYNNKHTGRDGGRSQDVDEYINKSKNIKKSSIRLASLLSDPEHINGTFNTELMKIFIDLMLTHQRNVSRMDLDDFRKTYNSELACYVQEAVNYASKLLKDSLNAMHAQMINKIVTLPFETLKSIIKKSQDDYNGQKNLLNSFFKAATGSNRDIMKFYSDKKPKLQILNEIFSEPGHNCDDSSAKFILYKNLYISIFNEDINKIPKLQFKIGCPYFKEYLGDYQNNLSIKPSPVLMS